LVAWRPGWLIFDHRGLRQFPKLRPESQIEARSYLGGVKK